MDTCLSTVPRVLTYAVCRRVGVHVCSHTRSHSHIRLNSSTPGALAAESGAGPAARCAGHTDQEREALTTGKEEEG